MKHSACMKLLSDLIDGETLTITNLTTNARMWSALRGERPSFYGLNMGLCLPFAVGVALAFPKRRVVAIDGDGSLIIETSSLITAADVRPANLTAVVFDNGVYGVMGETATARRTDLAKMAEGAGIAHTATLRTMEEYEKALRAALAISGALLMRSLWPAVCPSGTRRMAAVTWFSTTLHSSPRKASPGAMRQWVAARAKAAG